MFDATEIFRTLGQHKKGMRTPPVFSVRGPRLPSPVQVLVCRGDRETARPQTHRSWALDRSWLTLIALPESFVKLGF